ncbi:thiol-disulfide oxidoreductase LTO1 [Tanacetum coccineum]
MSSFINLSSTTALIGKPRHHHHHHVKGLKSDRCCWGDGRTMVFKVKCLNEPNSSRDVVESGSSGSGLSSSGGSLYSLCAGIGGLGFLETSYLTYSKLTGSEAFCPVGGGSCGDVLNSSYAVAYGKFLFELSKNVGGGGLEWRMEGVDDRGSLCKFGLLRK